MKCPTCPDATLVMSDRQGVEIDYCPSCRGIWLDRGELDKLLERSAANDATRAAPVAAAAAAAAAAPQRRPDFVDSDYRHGDPRYSQGQGHYRKKKSWLNEIFD